jgi:hypothetical protein
MTRHNEQWKFSSAGVVATSAAVIMLCTAAPVCATPASGDPADTQHSGDLHYTPVGFFDIHVCNWPDRDLFFMPLFSTSRYGEIKSVEVRYPDGHLLTDLDLENFKLLRPEGKPEKRVFISQIDVPKRATEGWYTATISLADGKRFTASDYVIVARLPRASGMNPPNGADQILAPEKLTWLPVANHSYYQVFIRDVWNDGKLLYKSKLLHDPELAIPPGLLQPDGLYSWQIHARDINEDKLLGDFNTGSMSGIATFSTATY